MTRLLPALALLLATPALAQLAPDFDRSTLAPELREPVPAPPVSDYALPDPTMTPGAVDTSQAVFCAHSSKERRHLPPGLSDSVARAYNVPPDDIGVLYQLDHLIPLSIGGATTALNLWPQPMREAGVKDRCDRRIHDLICRGKVAAADAQRAFAADWPTACRGYMER